MSWRDQIKIHPAADMFPIINDVDVEGYEDPVCIIWRQLDEESKVFDPYAYVVSANLHRRHLTREQRRGVIASLLKANPERSDNATAKIAKVSDKTVTSVRRKLAATSDLPKLDKTVGADGRARPARKARAAAPPSEPIPAAETAAKPADPIKLMVEMIGPAIAASPVDEQDKLIEGVFDRLADIAKAVRMKRRELGISASEREKRIGNRLRQRNLRATRRGASTLLALTKADCALPGLP